MVLQLKWRKSLDEVAEGKESWKKLLEDFYSDFDKAKKIASEGMERNSPILTDVKCDSCNADRKMHLRTNQNGQFLGCEGYLEEGDKQCKNLTHYYQMNYLLITMIKRLKAYSIK